MRSASSTRTALSPAEDTTHLLLLLVIGAAAGALLFSREPSPRADAAHAAPASEPVAADEATRPELDRAVSELGRWLEQTRREAGTSLDVNVPLLALGRAALEPDDVASGSARVWQRLDALAAPIAAAQPASLPAAAADGARDEESARATLAILLETGAPLEQRLPLPSGEVTLRHLLERALPARERRAASDAWALDLLAFAVLGGMSQHRAELTRSTLATLTRLEHEQRRANALDGAAAPGALDRIQAELGARDAAAQHCRELQLSASVFRAVAVLAEPELAQRGLRQLNALLVRYPLEREAYRRLAAQAPTPARRAAIHADALETLGRLEQALYGAHLAFRRSDRPAPRTAAIMRRAAHDLLEHLAALESTSALQPAPSNASPAETERLARAVAQALRGLRAARIAT